ncbi:MAG: hypothetical protein Ct9H90mP15_01530 [Candidatus Neomarinimicrobiota bacterium]|nr:MAG: hypothetical protein Ct9H90mP15_01530 [Candidatus Neomarinimicrobiota bacterium]
MAHIFQIGSGMVGSAMALDLAKSHNVSLSDNNLESLNKIKSQDNSISIHQLDVQDKIALQEWFKNLQILFY